MAGRQRDRACQGRTKRNCVRPGIRVCLVEGISQTAGTVIVQIGDGVRCEQRASFQLLRTKKSPATVSATVLDSTCERIE